jgi:hypothetical protein
MKKVLIFAAVAEAATGIALLAAPSLVGHLLFGQEFTGVTIPAARVTGIALIALAIACWPGPALVGMLAYGVAVTLYLAYVSQEVSPEFFSGLPLHCTQFCQFFSVAPGLQKMR